MPAEIAEANRTEDRIGECVADGVGIAVTGKAAGALDHDTAEHQRAVRVLGEAVDVDTLADAHVRLPVR
jgi:hypothetical protein